MSNAIMNAQFADNPAFLEYQDLLIQIQHAICRGDNQTANRLCDASEDLGQTLSLAEIQWLQWLSSDLEMLCGEELIQPAEQTEQEYARTLGEAWLKIEEQPEKVLSLLRRNQGFLSQAKVAYARARAYGILGYKNLRREFLRCASTLDPENIAYKIFLLGEAKRQHEFDEAQALAETIFNNSSSLPLAIFTAAGSLYALTQLMSASEARATLGKLRRRIQPIVDRNAAGFLEPKIAVFGLLLLGGISEGLNRKAAAKDAYLRATAIDPSDDGPLLLLGNLLAETDYENALLFFEKAIELETSFAMPYLHVTFKELSSANYQKSVRLAEKVLALTNATQIRAYAYESLGLAEFATNGLTEKILSHLQEATHLFPEHRGMRQNYEDAVKMYSDNQRQFLDLTLLKSMMDDLSEDQPLSFLDVRATDFLGSRLEGLSPLSSNAEGEHFALAA